MYVLNDYGGAFVDADGNFFFYFLSSRVVDMRFVLYANQNCVFFWEQVFWPGLANNAVFLGLQNFRWLHNLLGQVEDFVVVPGDDSFDAVLQIDQLVFRVEAVECLWVLSSEALFQIFNEMIISFAVDFVD